MKPHMKHRPEKGGGCSKKKENLRAQTVRPSLAGSFYFLVEMSKEHSDRSLAGLIKVPPTTMGLRHGVLEPSRS